MKENAPTEQMKVKSIILEICVGCNRTVVVGTKSRGSKQTTFTLLAFQPMRQTVERQMSGNSKRDFHFKPKNNNVSLSEARQTAATALKLNVTA